MQKRIYVDQDLNRQLGFFMTGQEAACLNRYNDPKLRDAVRINFKWIKKFCRLYYETRARRSNDLKDKKVSKARRLAVEYIGKHNHDFFVTCVDGRNMPTVMFSKPPHVGGVIRAPAGAVTGFMVGQKKDSVFVDYNSFVVKRIIDLLKEKVGDTIYYGLDSHLGCAARGQIHATEGGSQIDGGVRADITNKIITAQGILQLKRLLVNQDIKVADIVPLFFSYDPHSGGVIMGLELHVDDEEVAKVGFTDAVLDKLADNGRILRSTDLLKIKDIVDSLNNCLKPGSADFRDRYPESLLANWQAIVKLYDEGRGPVFRHIFDKIKKIYLGREIEEKTLRQKAKFMLKNLVTRYSISGADNKWPYDNHQEEMTVITEGGYAPFSELDAFAVFSRDLNSLITNTKLTVDLIRSFRRSGKIKNPVSESGFKDDNFMSAPVLISNKSILRNFQPKSWDAIKALEIDEIFANIDWDSHETLKWDKRDIQKLIFNATRNKNVSIDFDDALRFVDSIHELFGRMQEMMKDKHFRQMIVNGNIVVVNTLVDYDRTPRYIAPFVI